MPEPNDIALLAEYARTGSEPAFAALVGRHIHLVHSVALRHVSNPSHAEEITQAVFIILARKAKSLGRKTVLAGWLYQTARLTAANFLRAELRRQRREQEAYMESLLTEPTPETWPQIAPLLDDALGRLGEADRNMIVLRFFEKKSAREIATVLAIDPAAAQKRVTRAVERLRRIFLKRGVAHPAALLAETVLANAVQVAPAALAKSVTAVALAKSAAASTSTLTLVKGALKIMAWTKAKTIIAFGTASIALIVGISSISFFPRPHLQPNLPGGKVTPAIGMGYHNGVILAPDGSLWSWGDEALNWPVLGFTNADHSPYLHRIGRDNDWRSIAVGWDTCLAIKSDGSLWAWGANYSKQLGDGTKISRATPVRSVPGNDWKQVAASQGTSFALKNDGTLWEWGDLGTDGDSSKAVQIGTSTDWVRIWVGGAQMAGLQSDGSLWFWGSFPKNFDDHTRLTVPTRISPDTNWTDVCFGYFTVLAIKSDGTLWTWGMEANFYSGSNDTNLNTTPMQVGTDADWQACASGWGGFYALLRKKDGSLWALDASDHRAVKPDSEYKPVELKPIHLTGEIAAFGACGDNLGVVLMSDGKIWTWGNVLGEHPKSDYFGTSPRKIKRPKLTVRDQPWQLLLSE